MTERDLVYLGHMLDISREAVGRATELGRLRFDYVARDGDVLCSR